jgi:hypothetical protein
MPAQKVHILVENQVFGKRRHLERVAFAIDGYPSDGYSSSILRDIYSTQCVDIVNSRFCAPAGNATKYGIGPSVRYGIADDNLGGGCGPPVTGALTFAGGNHRQYRQRNQQWDDYV